MFALKNFKLWLLCCTLHCVCATSPNSLEVDSVPEYNLTRSAEGDNREGKGNLCMASIE